ncbi:hypothetical protein J3E68DRAFT_404956 [Trichoderma sp. SZMC 28012]
MVYILYALLYQQQLHLLQRNPISSVFPGALSGLPHGLDSHYRWIPITRVANLQCAMQEKKKEVPHREPPCHGACARVEKNSPKRTKLVPGPLNRVDGRQLRRCSGSVWTRSQPFFRVQRVGARGPVVDSALNRRLAGNEHASPSLVCRYGCFQAVKAPKIHRAEWQHLDCVSFGVSGEQTGATKIAVHWLASHPTRVQHRYISTNEFNYIGSRACVSIRKGMAFLSITSSEITNCHIDFPISLFLRPLPIPFSHLATTHGTRKSQRLGENFV